jgi:hypothetical protein
MVRLSPPRLAVAIAIAIAFAFASHPHRVRIAFDRSIATLHSCAGVRLRLTASTRSV